jgi:predicted nucleic acid-binding protein
MNRTAARVVVNTSPLIHLAEANLLHLLRGAAPVVWVPEPVAREIRAYGEHDPTARALSAQSWLEVKPVAALPAEIVAWNLGAGESAVLALARAFPGSTVIIDDLAGRRCAEALNLPLQGTVGLVLAAKQAGRITRARPILEHLRDHGMYLSDVVLDKALRWVGE